MRRLVAALFLASSGALSCGFWSAAPGVLPDVAAAPPAAAPASAWPEARDPRQREIHRVLKARSRGLTERELLLLTRALLRACDRHALEPRLVLAVIAVESSYDPFAVSPVGALGLMQIMPATGAELAAREGIHWRGEQTLFDPLVNVRLGVRYLRQLADRYDRLSTALAAYNWGPGHIDRRLRRGTPLPVGYPRLVFDAYDRHPGSRI